jgi:hypothetical protein
MGVNMAIHQEHELHRRRAKRNMLLGFVLISFVALVFGITMVKLKDGQLMRAFDATPQVSGTEANR